MGEISSQTEEDRKRDDPELKMHKEIEERLPAQRIKKAAVNHC